MSCQFLCNFLIEYASLRGEQDYRAYWRRAKNTFYGFKNWFRFHDHTAAAAVRGIVRGMVLIAGVITNVVQLHVNQAATGGLLQHADLQVGSEYFGQKREYIEAHTFILRALQLVVNPKTG